MPLGRRALTQQAAFLIPLALWLLAGGVLILNSDKAQLHLYINQWHSPPADIFFSWLTYLGDGLVFVFGALLSLRHSYRHFFRLVLAGLLTLLLVGFFKKVVFAPSPRPAAFFAERSEELRLVPGLSVNYSFSFPSGHTTAAFAFWGLMALGLSGRWATWGKVALFLLALSIGFSRIYLSQHFVEDVWAGSLLGFIIAALAYFYSLTWRKNWLQQRPFGRGRY